MSLLSFLFSPTGRVRRRDYWFYGLAVTAVSAIAQFAGHQVITGHPAADFVTDLGRLSGPAWPPLKIYIWALTLVFLWPGICISIKRWHDRNRPAWIPIVIYVANFAWSLSAPYVGPTTAHPNQWVYYGGLIILLAMVIWQLVECGCLDGTKGPNTYGPSPKGIASQADAF